MLTQIVTTKPEIAKVAACDQTGLATRAKLVYFSLDSDACFIDAILRSQPTQFDISGSVVHQNYDYYNDGRISFVHNTMDANFDRSYSYDHVGRLTGAKSGGQARNGPCDTPYSESFGYDAFANLTAR